LVRPAQQPTRTKLQKHLLIRKSHDLQSRGKPSIRALTSVLNPTPDNFP
jgi:hypothetical protein